MPAAGGEPGKERLGGGILIEVKRLRVELLREPFDLFGIQSVRWAGEGLADVQIVQKQTLSLFIHFSIFHSGEGFKLQCHRLGGVCARLCHAPSRARRTAASWPERRIISERTGSVVTRASCSVPINRPKIA